MGRLARRERPDSLTLGGAIERYAAHLEIAPSKRGLPYSRETIRGYLEHLDAARRHFGADTLLSALIPDACNAWLAGMRRAGATASTVQTRDKCLRLLFRWCVARGHLPRSPLDGQARIAVVDPPVEVLTDADVARLLSVCPPDTWEGLRAHALLLTLLRTGLRASELVSLDLDDYDSARGHLVVRAGKGGKRRVAGVPPDAEASITRWVRLARGEDAGPLFPSERGGRLRRDALTHLVQRLGRRAGVAKCHPHRFRHTFAVDCLRGGLDSYVVQRLLGHSTAAMTQRYLRGMQEGDAADAYLRAARRW